MEPESGERTGCSTACPLMRSKGACVFPSRPRPTRRSTGRIHISDFRQPRLTCERQPVHTLVQVLGDIAEVLSAIRPALTEGAAAAGPPEPGSKSKSGATRLLACLRLSVSASALSMSPAPLWTSGPPKSGQATAARRADWKNCPLEVG